VFASGARAELVLSFKEGTLANWRKIGAMQ
jgi:hypothetical protein